jgi:hypothetical protein
MENVLFKSAVVYMDGSATGQNGLPFPIWPMSGLSANRGDYEWTGTSLTF